MVKKIEPLSPSAVRQHLEPYATEIGQLTIAWNGLHENLAILFSYAIGPSGVPYAIWNRLSSDRTQRDILKVTVEAGAFLDHPHGRDLADEVLWLLKQTDALADRRNIGIHAPLTALTDLATGATRVAPQTFLGNRRAKSLAGKDVLNELIWYRESAEVLSRFAADLIRNLSASSKSWPRRPQLPTLQQKNPQR